MDSRIKVQYAAEQLAAEMKIPLRPFDRVSEEGKGIDLHSLLREAEVIYGLRLPKDIVERAPRLRWVHTSSAGIDTLIRTSLWGSDVVLTNSSGIHAIPMREHVLAVMLMFAKNAPQYFADKQQRFWKRRLPMELAGRTLGVVGMGRIGGEVARLAKAFEMRVIAVRRTAKPRETDTVADVIYPHDRLTDMLGESDFVLVAVALTEGTRRLIGEGELRAMRPTAYVINIARGPVIDETALARALKEGWIAGAGLDVFNAEPLPPQSELWDLPNVIITPHVAGVAETYNTRAIGVFCGNLRRYLSGKPLVNVIDKVMGY
ncbi:MAG: D-2-hydroxyacid dehydrogenase [Chloroflexota bacterium]